MESLKTLGEMILIYAKKNLFSSKCCYTEAVVQQTYVARNDEEFNLYPGDVIRNIVRKQGSWWKGELGGQNGCFHEKYVMFLPQGEEKLSLNSSRKSSKGLQKQYAKVLFNYVPINEDEFKLEAGDIIEVREEVEDGWWSGILEEQYGVFPSNYVVLLENKEYSSDEREDYGDCSNEKDDATSLKNVKQTPVINDQSTSNKSHISAKERFDDVRRSSTKLIHPTITRVKGPKRKPPTSKSLIPSVVKKERTKINGMVDNRSISSSNQSVQQSKPKVIMQPNVFKELKQKLRELENEIDDMKGELELLQKAYASKIEHQKLKIEIDSLREMIVTHQQSCNKLMSDLMCEVDEEKKLRSVVQIQLDRIMALLTCTCSKPMVPDIMQTDNSWNDTSL